MEFTKLRNIFLFVLFSLVVSSFLFGCSSNPSLDNDFTPIDSALLPEYEQDIDTTHISTITPKSTNNKTPHFNLDYSVQNKQSLEPILKKHPTKYEKSNLTLNFKNIGISELTSVVLNDLLKKTYTIDSDITGTVSIQTATPLTKTQLLSVLKDLIISTGNILTFENGIYRLQKDNNNLRSITSSDLNYQSIVVPLEYITTEQVKSLLHPYIDDVKISFDNVSDTVLLSGKANKINHLLQTINQFDISPMSKKSFLVAKLHNAEPQNVVTELRSIFSTINNKEDRLSFVDLSRINSILVISSDKQFIRTSQNWIKRLDVIDINQQSVHSYKVMHKKASVLHELFNSMVPNNKEEESTTLKSTFDDATNIIHFYTSKKEYDQYLPTLIKLDNKVSQVFIETTIIEVSLQGELRNGIEWYFKNKLSDHKSFNTGLDVAENGIVPTVPSFTFGIVDSLSALGLLFSTIESNSSVNVISSPSLVVLNNKTATINIGDQVPTLETQVSNTNTESVKNTIKYRDTGVIMEVSPQINNSNELIIKIKQELTDVVNTNTSGIDAPTFKKRSIDTEVMVSNNQTIVLGGLIRNDQENIGKNIPFLKKTALKNTFKNSSNSTNRTELIVLLKPSIIRSKHQITTITNDQKALFNRIRNTYSEK